VFRRTALTIALAIGASLVHASAAAACSVGPDFDPSAATHLLVRGEVAALEIGATTVAGYREAIVTLNVAWTYRGERHSQLRYVDRTSIVVFRDPRTGRESTMFVAGGSCGTLDVDPVGRKVLIALALGEDGRWYANQIYGAIYTDVVDHVAYRWVLERHHVPVPFLAFGGDPVTAGAVLVP
jgi:hypothetical protein